MPGQRIPGPFNQAARPHQVADGTLPVRSTPSPGPVDASEAARLKQELALDIAQFILDLVGIFEPTPFADVTSGLISVWRGDVLGAITSGASILPYLGDAAKVAKLPKYARSIHKAIELAKHDAQFAKYLEGALKRIKRVLDDAPLDSLPDNVKAQIQAIRGQIDNFLGQRWVKKISRGELLHEARKNGSSAGQFFVKRGDRWVTANVNDVVDLLEASSQRGRHPAARRNANALLEMMARKKWKVTAGPHQTAGGDMTKHITIRIDGIDQQYHLRLDRDGHLFEISHPRGTGLTDIKPWSGPGQVPPER